MSTTLVVRAKDDGLVFKHLSFVGSTHGSNHTVVAHPGPGLDMCYSRPYRSDMCISVCE